MECHAGSHSAYTFFFCLNTSDSSNCSTEVLEAIGVIDVDAMVSEQQTESMKQRVMGRLGNIKQSISHFSLKEMVNDPKQKAGALGIALGAIVGLML